MTCYLTLIAHASTAATAAAAFPVDEVLDEKGHAAASAIRERLSKAGNIFSAPELRARQTMAALELTGAIEPELRDWNYGRWAGRTLQDLFAEQPAMLGAWQSDPQFHPPEGESLSDVADRVERWLDVVATAGSRVLAITHPAVIRSAVIHAVAAPLTSFWRVDIAPLGKVQLSHDGRRWKLQSLS